MSYYTDQIKLHVNLFVKEGGQHKKHTHKRWVSAVRKGATLGYGEWVGEQVLAELVGPATPVLGVAPTGPYSPAPQF